MKKPKNRRLATKTLAQKFPRTKAQIEKELLEIAARLQILITTLQYMHTPGTETALNVVIPQADPRHKQGYACGSNLVECIKKAKKKAGRSGPVYGFIEMLGDISVAISPEDMPKWAYASQQTDNRKDHFRVVWSSKNRGSAWLVRDIEGL